jgi:RNA recognition motif-containing protein
MELWLGNLDSSATDDDVRELVRKYSKLQVTALRREAGDGSRPGVVLEFAEADAEALYNAQRRLHGLYWKGRAITAYLPMRPGTKK